MYLDLTQDTWIIVLSWIGVQGLILAVLLPFNRRGRRPANILLSLMMMATMAATIPWLLAYAGWLQRVPWVFYTSILIGLSTGPLYYFYVRTLLHPNYKLNIPLVALLALLPAGVRIANWTQHGYGPSQAAAALKFFLIYQVSFQSNKHMLFSVLFVAYYIVWLLFALRSVYQVKATLKKQAPVDLSGKTKWLDVLGANLGVLVIHQIYVWTVILTQKPHTLDREHTFMLSQCFLLQLIGIAVFFMPKSLSAMLSDTVLRRGRAPIDKEAGERYLRRLEAYMIDKKPYLKEGLRLPELADELSMPAHLLSQLINDHLRVNYFDFINGYRVQEAQELMKNGHGDQYTLLAIAREAGFNSKASFNRAFKKHAGMSPSEYRRLCREPKISRRDDRGGSRLVV